MSKKKIDVRPLLVGIIAENTIKSYMRAWEAYLVYAGSFDAALKGTTMTRWRQHMVAGDRAASSINTFLIGVKTIVRELYNHKEVSREAYWDIREVKTLPSTALKERRRPNNRVRIDPADMRKICKAPPVAADNPIALRDRALMMTLATTGARLSEALHIKVRDIHALPDNKFVVGNIMGKRDAEPRTVPLSPEAHSAILDWLAFRPVASPYVFTSFRWDFEGENILYSDTPMTPSCALHRVKLYGKEIGLPYIKCHDFRRFVGTQLAKKSLRTAQLVLGHASIATTANNYVLDEFEVGSTDNLF